MFIVAPIMGILYMFLVRLLWIALCPYYFCNHLDREEGAGDFTLFVYLMSCGCYFSAAIPYVDVGWSAVCDCGHTRLFWGIVHRGLY